MYTGTLYMNVCICRIRHCTIPKWLCTYLYKTCIIKNVYNIHVYNICPSPKVLWGRHFQLYDHNAAGENPIISGNQSAPPPRVAHMYMLNSLNSEARAISTAARFLINEHKEWSLVAARVL